MRTAALSLAVALLAVSLAADARSSSQRAAFQREQPCPATEMRAGPCPGWHVDHVVPLNCGGADHPRNMQWLTVAEHRAKTAREARLRCRPEPAPALPPPAPEAP